MIYYSDKHDTLTPKTWYVVNGTPRQYLGFTHTDAGRGVSYRFKGEGPNSYVNKTAYELDKTIIHEVTA